MDLNPRPSTELNPEVDLDDPRFKEFVAWRIGVIAEGLTPYFSFLPSLESLNPKVTNELWSEYDRGEYFLPGRDLSINFSFDLNNPEFRGMDG